MYQAQLERLRSQEDDNVERQEEHKETEEENREMGSEKQ